MLQWGNLDVTILCHISVRVFRGIPSLSIRSLSNFTVTVMSSGSEISHPHIGAFIEHPFNFSDTFMFHQSFEGRRETTDGQGSEPRATILQRKFLSQ
jgi:hypothetical protein